MPDFQSPSPVPPNASWWRRYLSSFRQQFFGRFNSRGDWLVFALVALAVLWLSARVFVLLRKLVGW